MDMGEIVAIAYYDTDGSGPWTYRELMARQSQRTETEWRRLEETVGRRYGLPKDSHRPDDGEPDE